MRGNKTPEFHDRLRKLRTGRGMTQGEAAALCGMQESAWSRIETGNQSPTLKTLERLCYALDLGSTEAGWLAFGATRERESLNPSLARSARIIKGEADSILGALGELYE